MSLSVIALGLAGIGALGTLYLAAIFLRDPASALGRVQHLSEELPKVMTGRYIGNAILALAALIYGDFRVIAVLYTVFAFESLYDVLIYRRIGKPFMPHLQGAVLSALVAMVAIAVQMQGGV